MSKKLVNILLVGVVCLSLLIQSYNSCVKLHFHKDSFGRIIAHCHPWQGTSKQTNPFPQHTHSKIEFLVHFILSMVEFLLVLLVLRFAFKDPFSYFRLQTCRVIKSSVLFPVLFRAPPLM